MERPRREFLFICLLLALVAAAVVRSAAGTRLDGFTFDEPWHTVAGASYLRHGDYALNPEHPPLVKLWAGAFTGPGFTVPPRPPLHEKGRERKWVEQVMYGDNAFRQVQSRTRAAMWALHAALLLALGGLLWLAFGPVWAAGTLAFLALEPSVGAYLPVVMTDLPVALTLGLSALALGLLLATWRWPWALLLGLALGLALGSKHSALTGLVGLAVFAVLGWLWQARGAGSRANLRRALQLGVAAALALVLLWGQYGFRFHARADGSDGFNREMAAKIDDLRMPHYKAPLAFADRHRLLPRAYLWGLADTVRAGVEGRGETGTLLWGRFVPGPPPWYTWPSLLVVKVPLALLVMSALGVWALLRLRLRLPVTARWVLLAVLAMGLGHGLSLVGARTAYAGVRHAMPLVLVLAVLAGGWLAWAWRPAWRWRAAALLPLVVAALMTLREPRLWEYHNELVGGTAQAWRQFDNEGMDLGQRWHEAVDYGQRAIAPSGQRLYVDYWVSQAFNARAPFPMMSRVQDIHDDNVAGVYEGWFLKYVGARLPEPHFGYDPKEELAGLTPMARFGNTELWRGRQERPRPRAWALAWRVVEYVYEDGGEDWALVAKRTQEIVDQLPHSAPVAIELGNAHLRLGNRAAARKAYADVLAQTQLPVEPLTRKSLEAQLAKLDSGMPLSRIAPLRNPSME